jgi:TetR/AcrR family transcriptional regulator
MGVEGSRSGLAAMDHSIFERGVGGGDADQETRERILLAAASLFANKGYAGTAVREIVAAAGVTKPALYYYFKNKEDLYVRLLDHATATFLQFVDTALAGPGGVRERMVALYSTIYVLFRERLDAVRLVYSMLYGPQGAAPAYDFSKTHQHLDSVVREILQEGVATGELQGENLEEAVFMLLGMMDSLSCTLVTEPERPAFTARDIGRLIDLVFDGVRGTLRPRE